MLKLRIVATVVLLASLLAATARPAVAARGGRSAREWPDRRLQGRGMTWDEWNKQREKEARAREEERRNRLREDALETVRDMLKVRWIETPMPTVKESTKTKTIMACIKALGVRKSGRRPSLLLFISREVRNGRPTRQAEAGDKLLREVFAGEGDPRRLEKADMRVPLSLLFFDCFLVDTTAVTSKDNRFLNNHSVPFAVFADTAGKIGRVAYTAGQCKTSFVLGAVQRLLQAEHPRFKYSLANLDREFKRLVQAEYRVRLNERYQDTGEIRFFLMRVRRESEFAGFMQQLERDKREKFLAELDRYDASCAIFFLLREEGLEANRLPPKPRRPRQPDINAAARAARKLLRFKPRNVKLPKNTSGIHLDLQGFVRDVIARAGGGDKGVKPVAPYIICGLAFSGEKADFSPRILASIDTWATVFRGQVNPRKPMTIDFRPAIAARLFNCVLVNLMHVKPAPNRQVSRAQAPLVVAAEPNGKIMAVLRTDKERSPAGIYARMRDLLANKECANLVEQANLALRAIFENAYRESALSDEERLLSDALRGLRHAPPMPFMRGGRRLPVLGLAQARLDQVRQQQEQLERDRRRVEAGFHKILASVTHLGARRFEPARPAPAREQQLAKSQRPAADGANKSAAAKPSRKGDAPAATRPATAGKRPPRYEPVNKRDLRARLAAYRGKRVRLEFVFRGMKTPAAEVSRQYPKITRRGGRELTNKRNYLDAKDAGAAAVKGVYVVLPSRFARDAQRAQAGDTLLLDCRLEVGNHDRDQYFLRVENLHLLPPRGNTP